MNSVVSEFNMDDMGLQEKIQYFQYITLQESFAAIFIVVAL